MENHFWSILSYSLTVGQLCALQNFVSSKNSPSVMSVKTPKKRASTKRKLVAVEDEEVIDLRDDAAESDVEVNLLLLSSNHQWTSNFLLSSICHHLQLQNQDVKYRLVLSWILKNSVVTCIRAEAQVLCLEETHLYGKLYHMNLEWQEAEWQLHQGVKYPSLSYCSIVITCLRSQINSLCTFFKGSFLGKRSCQSKRSCHAVNSAMVIFPSM